MKRTILILSASLALYASCSKDESPAPAPAQSDIIGKWSIEYTRFQGSVEGHLVDSTIPGNPGDYFDVRNDGYAYSYFENSYDTTGYKVLDNNSKIVFIYRDEPDFPDTIDIKTLTKNSLVLYQKTQEGPDYIEVTQSLKK